MDFGIFNVLHKKVLGPLEKIIMFSTVMVFSIIQRFGSKAPRISQITLAVAPLFKWVNRCLAVLAWLDAQIMPRALATVVFVRAVRTDLP